MDPYLTAQALSFIGFSIVLYGVASRARKKLIGFDAIGLTLVTLHWYLLDAPVAVASNAIFVLNDVIALLLPDRVKAQLRNAIAAILIVITGVWLFQEAHDVLPIIASALILFGIQQKNLVVLRWFMIAASLVWTIYGINHETWVQVGFGVVLAAVHGYRLYELRKSAS